MANRWGNSGTSGWLYLLGLQNHCRWWLQPLKDASPWQKSCDQPRQPIKKQRHYFVNKGPSSQVYGFSSSHVWMWELDYKERWASKNWCFWTVVLEKTLGRPLVAKSVNQSILKEISPGISLEGMMIKLKLQYFGHLMQRIDHWKRRWCWEGMGAGGEGDDRGWNGWMASLTQWTRVWASSGRWWRTGKPDVLQSMGLQRVWHNWATEQKQETFKNML